ncbi:hypothetical protein FCOIX_13902 [Fusarium coicis]|nr:hypothetical protein FCOIX_13902 [Fusarium coicis]
MGIANSRLAARHLKDACDRSQGPCIDASELENPEFLQTVEKLFQDMTSVKLPPGLEQTLQHWVSLQPIFYENPDIDAATLCELESTPNFLVRQLSGRGLTVSQIYLKLKELSSDKLGAMDLVTKRLYLCLFYRLKSNFSSAFSASGRNDPLAKFLSSLQMQPIKEVRSDCCGWAKRGKRMDALAQQHPGILLYASHLNTFQLEVQKPISELLAAANQSLQASPIVGRYDNAIDAVYSSLDMLVKQSMRELQQLHPRPLDNRRVHVDKLIANVVPCQPLLDASANVEQVTSMYTYPALFTGQSSDAFLFPPQATWNSLDSDPALSQIQYQGNFVDRQIHFQSNAQTDT